MHNRKVLFAAVAAVVLAAALCIVFFVIIPGGRDTSRGSTPAAAGPAGPGGETGISGPGGADTTGSGEADGSGGGSAPSGTKTMEYADPEPGSIVSDPDGGGMYVNNELLVIVKEGTRREEVEAFALAHGGTIVGTNDYLREYQIRFAVPADSLSGLESVREAFMDSGLFSECFANYVLDLALDGSDHHPNDSKWSNWDSTSDLHWGIDAIRAPEMWYGFDMTARMPVRVGVLDNQFYTDHEDLRFKEVFHNKFDEKESSHGTHVSGIIAAIFNNRKGIAGIIPSVELYGASINGIDNYDLITVSEFQAGLTYLIAIRECKVINLSYGYRYGDPSYFKNEVLNKISKPVETALRMFLDEGLEFLIVKSAGNYRGNPDDIFRNASFNILSSITDPRFRDRIIVVGAARPDGNSYQVCNFSSYGPRVDLIAPGWQICSTVYSPNTSFELFHNYSGYSKDWDGTSMAAPHVTGTAAAVWCVNPNLTGAEVKEILIRTATGSYTYPPPDTETNEYVYCYPMVDAYAAVDMASRWDREKKAPSYYYNPKSPAIRERDVVYASTRDEAYAILQQRYQAGISHYREMQEEDNALLTEYGDEFAGNTPLYPTCMDVTGDGTPELLFLATRDDVEDWNYDSADLFIYTWKGNHAEQILWIDNFYAIAGNGPWYEIFQDDTGNGTLYFSYGCDSPGVREKYELNEVGQYALSMSVSGYRDYEAESEDDAYTYYMFSAIIHEDEYEAARFMAEAPDGNRRLLFSTSEPALP